MPDCPDGNYVLIVDDDPDVCKILSLSFKHFGCLTRVAMRGQEALNLTAHHKEKFIRKCNILQQYAASKKGKLYLIIPIQLLDRVIMEINKNNLENIGILQIKTG